MRIEQKSIAFAYFRLSREETQKGESSSITNQRMIGFVTGIRVYKNGNDVIILLLLLRKILH